MKKILLFQLKPVCYDSYIYFSQSVEKELIASGYEVFVFSSANESMEQLERLAGQHFDAVIDFNSDLPKLKMDDDTYFLDHIDAPFYDVILDHPLYHHDMLKQTLSHFHVLCLDYNHKEYVKRYYSHIKSAEVWPMTGEEYEENSGRQPEKTIDLLFTGTYTDSRTVKESMEKIPDFIKEITEMLISAMEANPILTQESALEHLLPSLDEVAQENFPLFMQACFFADTYLRAFRREHLLLSLAESGLPLTICGNGWQKSTLSNYPNVKIMDDISFFDTFPLFAKAKIVLNIMPGFVYGTHDRVYSAMLNKSLCLTDATPLLKQQFTDGRDICFYDPADSTSLPVAAKRLLDSWEDCTPIIEAGYETAKIRHTWLARVTDLTAILFPG